MKRRLLKVEMERRRSEDMRKQREKGGKTADEVRAAASHSRLARAGYRRRFSIMHVGGGAAEVSCVSRPRVVRTLTLRLGRGPREARGLSRECHLRGNRARPAHRTAPRCTGRDSKPSGKAINYF